VDASEVQRRETATFVQRPRKMEFMGFLPQRRQTEYEISELVSKSVEVVTLKWKCARDD
jgi:hypothetical protein